MPLSRGAEAAEKIADEIARARKRSFGRLDQLIIKDGDDPVYLRLITDKADVYSFEVHSYMPTKPQPEGFKGDKWPDKMWGVCRKDRQFRLGGPDGMPLEGWEDGYDGVCYLHDRWAGVPDPKFKKDMSRTRYLTYGIAAVRELVKDPATGKPVGLRDKMTEHKDKDGNVHQVPQLVIVAMNYETFWAAPAASAYITGTWSDADVKVTRKENEYTVATLRPTPDLAPGTKAWEAYTSTLELIGFDLETYLLDHSTLDHYRRWFIEGEEPEGGYGRKGQDGEDEDGEAASETASASAPTVDAPAAQKFRDRVKKRAPAADGDRDFAEREAAQAPQDDQEDMAPAF